jgi:6-phosphofructokinase 1
VKRYESCTIAVSEGLRRPDGRFVSETGLHDAFGHAQLGGVAPVVAQLVHEKLGHKYHWAVADYLQRSARHIASKTDLAQSYAVGKAAVEFSVKGYNGTMPIIVRKSNRPYRWVIGKANLADIANRERFMPPEFIREDGFHITDRCREYLSPLIAGEAYPPYRNGLPKYVRLKNRPVAKKLAASFSL